MLEARVIRCRRRLVIMMVGLSTGALAATPAASTPEFAEEPNANDGRRFAAQTEQCFEALRERYPLGRVVRGWYSALEQRCSLVLETNTDSGEFFGVERRDDGSFKSHGAVRLPDTMLPVNAGLERAWWRQKSLLEAIAEAVAHDPAVNAPALLHSYEMLALGGKYRGQYWGLVYQPPEASTIWQVWSNIEHHNLMMDARWASATWESRSESDSSIEPIALGEAALALEQNTAIAKPSKAMVQAVELCMHSKDDVNLGGRWLRMDMRANRCDLVTESSQVTARFVWLQSTEMGKYLEVGAVHLPIKVPLARVPNLALDRNRYSDRIIYRTMAESACSMASITRMIVENLDGRIRTRIECDVERSSYSDGIAALPDESADGKHAYRWATEEP